MKKIKVALDKLDKNSFPIKVLFNHFNVREVQNIEDANLILEGVDRNSDFSFMRNDKKTIIISYEDLYIKRNLFNFIESFFHKIGFKTQKYKIMDKLDFIFPDKISSLPISYFLPKHLKFVKEIEGKKNKYAIIQNDIRKKKVFIMPVFVQEYYEKLGKLLKKKIPSKIELKKKKFCAFIVSSNSSRERIRFFKMLSKYKKVDSYGKVMNNMGDKIQSKDWKTNSELFEEYKFVICFENNFSDEYITEKLPNVMFANSIPIYRGAPDTGKYFNTKSFINYEDYGSYKNMIKKIIELDKDDDKYIDFLNQTWFKNNKIPETIKSKEAELIQFYNEILKE